MVMIKRGGRRTLAQRKNERIVEYNETETLTHFVGMDVFKDAIYTHLDLDTEMLESPIKVEIYI